VNLNVIRTVRVWRWSFSWWKGYYECFTLLFTS
jgi:hypothetical protein